MATSRTFDQFSDRINEIATGIVKNVEKTVRKAALVFDQVVVLATPVDTGRARANWIATIAVPSNSTKDETDPSGQATIAQAASVIKSYKLGAGGIFITNNVAYIVPLEEGSSQQAPNGMTKQGLLAASRVFRKARIL